MRSATGQTRILVGPDDFNGYGYFSVPFYCNGVFQADIVEIMYRCSSSSV